MSTTNAAGPPSTSGPTSASALMIASLHASAGNPDEAIRTLQAARAMGEWWHGRLLREFPFIAELDGEPGFQELVAASQAACDEAQRASTTPDALVFVPRAKPEGVLLAVHDAMSRPRGFACMWLRPTLSARLALVVPQSPKLACSGGFRGWEPERALEQVVREYERVAAQRELEGLPIVLAGFSQGAALAARWSIEGSIPNLLGFAGVAPARINVAPWATLSDDKLRTVAERGVRAWLAAGEHDWARLDTERLRTLLERAGLEVPYELMPGVGHGVDRDFGARATRALAHICGDRLA